MIAQYAHNLSQNFMYGAIESTLCLTLTLHTTTTLSKILMQTTPELLDANYKDGTLRKFCGELGIKKSGRKKEKAERICAEVRNRVNPWTPPTPPDKEFYNSRSNHESEITLLPLVPLLPDAVDNTAPAWTTAGELVPAPLVISVMEVEEDITNIQEACQRIAKPDPTYIINVSCIGKRTKVKHLPIPKS